MATIMVIRTTMIIPTVIDMDNVPLNSGGLYRLLAWLSPSYPVGAFAYSHGIEWAVETGAVGSAGVLAEAAASIRARTLH